MTQHTYTRPAVLVYYAILTPPADATRPQEEGGKRDTTSLRLE